MFMRNSSMPCFESPRSRQLAQGFVVQVIDHNRSLNDERAEISSQVNFQCRGEITLIVNSVSFSRIYHHHPTAQRLLAFDAKGNMKFQRRLYLASFISFLEEGRHFFSFFLLRNGRCRNIDLVAGKAE